MITKVIGTAGGFYDVTRYLKTDRETGEDRDTGFRMGYNVSPDALEAAQEMSEAAEDRLMHQPCLHVVLSPAPPTEDAERLSPAELDDMVSDLRREMGWQDYQILAVEHLDTDHQHVHLVINRAHPLDSSQHINPYHLYNDLRQWAQGYAERRHAVEIISEPDEAASAHDVAQAALERYQAALADETTVLDRAAAAYHDNLQGPSGRRARAYLAERGISAEVSERYELGYAPDQWRYLARRTDALNVDLQDLKAVDLVRDRRDGQGVYDTFRGRVMMPYREAGHVAGFSGRLLPELEDRPGKGHRYTNSKGMAKSHAFYGWDQAQEAIQREGTVYLVEGQFDTLAMASASRGNVLGVGRAVLSDPQATRLAGHVDHAVLVPDGDVAGRASILKNAEKLAEHGVEARVVILQGGKDAGDVVERAGAEALHRQTARSVHVLEVAPFVAEVAGQEARLAHQQVDANDWAARYINRFPESERVRLLSHLPEPQRPHVEERLAALKEAGHARQAGKTTTTRRKWKSYGPRTSDRWVSPDLVQAVRDQVSAVDVAKRYTSLKQDGADWKGCCPAHKDKDPSFHVHPKKGYHCFGCGFEGGDAIDLVMKLENVDFQEAVRRLAQEYHIHQPGHTHPARPHDHPGPAPDQQPPAQAPAPSHTPEPTMASDTGIKPDRPVESRPSRDAASSDRAPAPRQEETPQTPVQRSDGPHARSGPSQHQLQDLNSLPERTGLTREVSTLTELEHLAHEKELAQVMLKADAAKLQKTGSPLLSDEQRRTLTQAVQEIDDILKKQRGIVNEGLKDLPQVQAKPQAVEGSVTKEPPAAPSWQDLNRLVEQSYRDLVAEACPYWMHAEGAVEDMQDLATLRGHDEVIQAIKRQPDAFNERTTTPMSEADANRVAEAYRRYETNRRQYMAQGMERIDVQNRTLSQEASPLPQPLRDDRDLKSGEPTQRDAQRPPAGREAATEPVQRTAPEPDARHEVPSSDKAPQKPAKSPERPLDPVEAAQQVYYRDVASQVLGERIENVQESLRTATKEVQQIEQTVRKRAFHNLRTSLQETYKDPVEAFRRLEALHARGEAAKLARNPEALGEVKRTSLRRRARGDTPGKRAADIAQRYGTYVDGPDVRSKVSVARRRVEGLKEELGVLKATQKRIGTPETIQKAYGQVQRGLSPKQRARLGARMQHLPRSEVRRKVELLIRKALRERPGPVRPGHIKGLASRKAVNRALQKTARNLGTKLSLKKPLQFALKAAKFATHVGTRAVTMAYRAARAFFDR